MGRVTTVGIVRVAFALGVLAGVGAPACTESGTAPEPPGAAGRGDAGAGGEAPQGSGGDGGGAVAGAPASAGGQAGADVGGAGPGGEGGAAPRPKSFEVTDCNGVEVAIDDSWVRYCTVMASCSEGGQPAWCLTSPREGYSFQFSSPQRPPYKAIHEPPHGPFESLSCPLTVESCEDVLHCAGRRRLQDDCKDDSSARCDGERAINCETKAGVKAYVGVQDCERLTGKKGACQVLGTGDEAHAACVLEQACNEPGSSCKGDQAHYCDGGVAVGTDCARFDLTCRDGACAPPYPTETCENKGYPFCAANSLAYCSPDGVLFKGPDCAEVGDLVCTGGGADHVDDNWWNCAPRGCSIADWNGGDFGCDGDDYVADLGFWSVRVHCPDYGFKTCAYGGCRD